jgi:two-component system alkaline phosphatase synthesis response regulator PhoP
MDKVIKVVLVDDETSFVEPMSLLFQEKGYSVSVVSNGKDALKKIKEDKPDIVFIDLIMPDMDGYTVLKKIREINQTLPVIMMSGYIEDTRVEKKINLQGVFATYYKGNDFSEALSLLKSALKLEE